LYFRFVHIHRLCEDFAFNIKYRQHSVSKFYLDYIVEKPTVSEVFLTEHIFYDSGFRYSHFTIASSNGESARAHSAFHYIEKTVIH
jgi:hypothetical protein